MRYVFTEEEIAEIQEARRKNRDKNVERRLKALELKATGCTGQEIAKQTDYNPGYISKLAAKYRKGGIEAITGNHYGGNHRNMTYEEEAEVLEKYIHAADGGHITDVSAIKSAYDEKIGHQTGHACIERGVTSFDTAAIYGRTACESQIGEAFAYDPSLRSQIQLVSKTGICGRTINGKRFGYYDTTYDHVMEACKQSLQRLQTDHLICT